MSSKWNNIAFKARVGNPIRKIILIKLADQANDDGECWPSQNTLADAAECSRKTVSQHVKKMASLGYFTFENRKRDNGSKTSNLYILTMDDAGNPCNPHVTPSSYIPCNPQTLHGACNPQRLQQEPSVRNQQKEKSIYRGSSEYSIEFQEFWKLYQMKGTKKTAFAQWKKLDHNQMTMALNSLEYYFQENPDKQYRKDAERFIRDRLFESVMERAESGNLIIPRQSFNKPAPTTSPQDLFDHVDPHAPDPNWNANAKRMQEERERAAKEKQEREQNGGA